MPATLSYSHHVQVDFSLKTIRHFSSIPHAHSTLLPCNVTCSSYSYHMRVTCSPHAYHMCVTCTLHAHVTCVSHAFMRVRACQMLGTCLHACHMLTTRLPHVCTCSAHAFMRVMSDARHTLTTCMSHARHTLSTCMSHARHMCAT